MPDRIMKPTPETAFVYLRAYLMVHTLATCGFGIFGSAGLAGLVRVSATAEFVIWCLALAALAGLADVIYNDFMRGRFSAPVVRRNRHFGYMLIALMNVAMVLTMIRENMFSLAVVRYLIDASGAALIAVGHTLVNQRHRQWPYTDRRRRATDSMPPGEPAP